MIRRSVHRLRILTSLTHAHATAWRLSGRVAPGVLSSFDPSHDDQTHLLRLHRRHGPLFKIWWGNKLTTCIVGHALGMRFLAENKGRLRAATADLTALFPGGFLRGLEGDSHSDYRRRFLAAFKAVSVGDHEAAIRAIFRDRLATLADGGGRPDAAAIAVAARRAATAAMLHLVLGVEDKSETADRLTRAYDAYAPDSIPVFIGTAEQENFARIKALMLAHAQTLRWSGAEPRSLLEHVTRSPDFDDTVAGNLIQMVENGRYDSDGLWRWLLLEIAGQPAYLDRLGAEPDPARRAALAAAAVHETLRLAQSEYIHRVTTENIVFDGVAIPRRSWVRICIWEGHRDPAKFERPDEFVPDRFLDAKPPADAYAPLGLDHHRCLGAAWSIDLGALLVDEVAENFSVGVIARGTPAKARFHFAPGADCRLSWAWRATPHRP
jgi:cytochrome P450